MNSHSNTPAADTVTAPPSVIDPADLDTCLKVLDLAGTLDAGHPDAIAVQRAAAHMFKKYKRLRRNETRTLKVEADRDVLAATATGSPTRIDDETAGLTLTSTTRGASAGTLLRPRNCYVCKDKFTRVDAFYHQLCPTCATENHAKRDARTDLTGRRALLTGGRAKIGMYIALRLLRDGAHTTIITRTTRSAGSRRWRTAPTGSTGCGSSGSTCVIRRRWWLSPTMSRRRGRSTS